MVFRGGGGHKIDPTNVSWFSSTPAGIGLTGIYFFFYYSVGKVKIFVVKFYRSTTHIDFKDLNALKIAI